MESTLFVNPCSAITKAAHCPHYDRQLRRHQPAPASSKTSVIHGKDVCFRRGSSKLPFSREQRSFGLAWWPDIQNARWFCQKPQSTVKDDRAPPFSRGVLSDDMQSNLKSGMSANHDNSTEVSPRQGVLPTTVYLVDVHPLCYEGKIPRPTAILQWMKLLFNQVSLADPVIAVMDGERGNTYRRQLLPGYKAKRNHYRPYPGIHGSVYSKGDGMDLRHAFPYVKAFLAECNVPVLKVADAEADDVIATLMQQAVDKGMKVVVASPDMDYRQLLCHNVKLLLPLPKYGRWSFYTLQQYKAEHDCEPSSDLGLRCMLGDQSDNIPGLAEWVPGFGRKTALKLMKKHGSLENLLSASEARTIGKPLVQEALAQHRNALYRNLQVLSLRRDIDVKLEDEWCASRDRSNDNRAFERLHLYLSGR